MLAPFILIIMLHVNSGSVITFQEFATQQSCHSAMNMIIEKVYETKASGFEFAICVRK